MAKEFISNNSYNSYNRYCVLGCILTLATVVTIPWLCLMCMCGNDLPAQVIKCNVQEYYSQAPDQISRQRVCNGGMSKKGGTIRLTAHFENAKYHQWYQNGIRIEGCTGNTLIIEDAILENTGLFSLVVANEDFETTTMKVDIV